MADSSNLSKLLAFRDSKRKLAMIPVSVLMGKTPPQPVTHHREKCIKTAVQFTSLA
ncbi:hypothetical protein DPMN_022680 [Dreissena polymorpha]|uniref:Uncharacterized protein n=1 Tax=Dreissena polymorpha TaxID=45954 RepID=A0A9D4NPA7_DREPO|nr:hypothetical protein DPMN_022680 [Dreissena polymorpha]